MLNAQRTRRHVARMGSRGASARKLPRTNVGASIAPEGPPVRRRPYGAIMDDVMRSLRAAADEETRLARILELMDAEAGTPAGGMRVPAVLGAPGVAIRP